MRREKERERERERGGGGEKGHKITLRTSLSSFQCLSDDLTKEYVLQNKRLKKPNKKPPTH